MEELGGTPSHAELLAEIQRLQHENEQRAAELAVINSIQQGMAAELDFQGIIDLVGGKIREVMHTDEIGIRWYDEPTDLIHYLYEFEHGERLEVPSQHPPAGSLWHRMRVDRRPIVLNSVAEWQASGIPLVPGTDQSKSMVNVPIIGSDRVLGTILLENYDR